MDAYQRRALELLGDPETTQYPTRADCEAVRTILAERDELLEACKKALTCGLGGTVRELVKATLARANGGPS